MAKFKIWLPLVHWLKLKKSIMTTWHQVRRRCVLPWEQHHLVVWAAILPFHLWLAIHLQVLLMQQAQPWLVLTSNMVLEVELVAIRPLHPTSVMVLLRHHIHLPVQHTLPLRRAMTCHPFRLPMEYVEVDVEQDTHLLRQNGHQPVHLIHPPVRYTVQRALQVQNIHQLHLHILLRHLLCKAVGLVRSLHHVILLRVPNIHLLLLNIRPPLLNTRQRVRNIRLLLQFIHLLPLNILQQVPSTVQLHQMALQVQM